MTPRRPSLPRIISRTLGPGRGVGTARIASTPAGAARRAGPGDVGDVAVLVALHARGAGRDPAAERRVGEAVGEVAEGPAAGVELLLEVGALARRPGCGRGRSPRRCRGPSSRRPMSSETTVRSSVGSGSRLPTMLLPPPKGMSTSVARDGEVDDALHLGLVGRVDDQVGHALEDRRRGCGSGRGCSCRRCARRGRGRPGRRARARRSARASRRPPRRRGRPGTVRSLNDERRARLAARQVDADDLLHERRERGLVLVVEGDALDAPAPPLHVLDVVVGGLVDRASVLGAGVSMSTSVTVVLLRTGCLGPGYGRCSRP